MRYSIMITYKLCYQIVPLKHGFRENLNGYLHTTSVNIYKTDKYLLIGPQYIFMLHILTVVPVKSN